MNICASGIQNHVWNSYVLQIQAVVILGFELYVAESRVRAEF